MAQWCDTGRCTDQCVSCRMRYPKASSATPATTSRVHANTGLAAEPPSPAPASSTEAFLRSQAKPAWADPNYDPEIGSDGLILGADSTDLTAPPTGPKPFSALVDDLESRAPGAKERIEAKAACVGLTVCGCDKCDPPASTDPDKLTFPFQPGILSVDSPAPPTGTDPGYMQVHAELEALHIRKSSTYGTDGERFHNFVALAEITGFPPEYYAWLRIAEKATRAVNQIQAGDPGSVKEGPDVAGLAIIAEALRRRVAP